MTDETSLPEPNEKPMQYASRLARDKERRRCLGFIALAKKHSIPEPILKAIADGTSVYDFDRSQRQKAADPQRGSIKPGTSAAGSGGSRWGAITSRLNAQRRAASEPTDTEGSAA